MSLRKDFFFKIFRGGKVPMPEHANLNERSNQRKYIFASKTKVEHKHDYQSEILLVVLEGLK